MTQSKKKTAAGSQARMLWFGVGAAVVIFIVIAVFAATRARIPFEMTDGDVNPVVLLRNEATAFYVFEYTGNRPAELTRVVPRIQLGRGQVMTVDVKEVLFRMDGETIPLENGSFPEGTQIVLEPGDTFEIGVVYLGQELGWNRIFGFRLQYVMEGRSFDAELELKDDYYVFVE